MGRSCLLLSLAGKRVLLDCGVNPGRDDASVLPEFSLLGPAAELTAALDVVIISHFHLDHIGALPHLTEVLGYRGPIVMTHPTKAIAPMLLRDFRKVSADRQRRKAGGSAAAAAQHVAINTTTTTRAYNLRISSRITIRVALAADQTALALGAALVLSFLCSKVLPPLPVQLPRRFQATDQVIHGVQDLVGTKFA